MGGGGGGLNFGISVPQSKARGGEWPTAFQHAMQEAGNKIITTFNSLRNETLVSPAYRARLSEHSDTN